MSTKAPAIPNDQKRATFDPADFLPDDSVEETPDGVDYGDDFTPTDDDEGAVTEEEPAEEEPAEEEPAEEEPAEEEPAEEEPSEEEPAVEEPAEETPAEEEPAAKQRGKPGHMIPKARLDHQIALTRDMQKKIAA